MNEKATIMNQFQAEGFETLDWILYDSLLTTASATQNLTFFQNTIGTVGRARTNMKSAGVLPQPQAMLIHEISYKIFNQDGTAFFMAGGAAPSVYPPNFINSRGFFDVVVSPSVEYEGHLMQFREQQDYVNDTAATLGVATMPGAMNLRTLKLKKPIVLLPQRSFSLNLTVTTPAAAQGYVAAQSLIMFFLKGVMRRNA
jgi:hypothetical protein